MQHKVNHTLHLSGHLLLFHLNCKAWRTTLDYIRQRATYLSPEVAYQQPQSCQLRPLCYRTSKSYLFPGKRGEILAFDAMPLAEWVGLADNLDEAEPVFNKKGSIYGLIITSLVSNQVARSMVT